MEIRLKYGCNPHQVSALIAIDADPAPLRVLNGTPGYINLLDALGAWPLAMELKEATGKAGAASFKHTSPAGAAVARPLDDGLRAAMFLPSGDDLSPVAQAYVRARAGDRMSSFGDLAAVSEVVDVALARVLRREVSDGIIAPGYDPEALDILRAKKGGKFLILEMDADYAPPARESRELYGFRLEQDANLAKITREMIAGGQRPSANKDLPDDIVETLIVGTIALKYTQSNSVCICYDGQVVGMGAGQQSRVHCTRLACDKADKWFLQQHPRVLDLKFKAGLGRPERTNIVDNFLLWDQLSAAEVDFMVGGLDETPEPLTRDEKDAWLGRQEGICLSSDAFLPFRDNVDRASRSHVQYIVQAGGSARDDLVTAAADEYSMVMVHTGMRWFLH